MNKESQGIPTVNWSHEGGSSFEEMCLYVQNDSNLCSGEATVRSLLLGLPLIQGLEKAEGPALKGALSSRPYLKLLNMQCQNLLELVLEPLYAQLSLWTDGAVEYPAERLDQLWASLLKNHARDSIRGCGPDLMHQENENRFMRILAAAKELRLRGLNHLVQRIDRRGMDLDGYLLTVVNTLPYERAEFVDAELHPLVEDSLEAFGLLDEQGKPVEFELLESSRGNRTQRHRIRFRMAVPPCGYRTLHLFQSINDSGCGNVMCPAPKGWVMQNEYMRVVVGADGQIDLLDSETGIESPDLLGFEDVADIGDASSFTPDPDTGAMDCSVKPVVSILANRGVRLEYNYGVTLDLTLDAGCRYLAVKATVDNRHRNHRLRLLVHTDVHSEEDISSQPFDCVRRDCNPELRQDGTKPNNGLIFTRDWNKQISIFNDGIYEYEHLRDSLGTIALTLMRSTEGSANALENHCLREVSYRLAIRPGHAHVAQLMQEMQCFQVPMLAVFDAVDSRKLGGDPLPPAGERTLSLMRGGLKVDNSVVFSTLKRSQDRDAWIVRFFNPSDEAVLVGEPKVAAVISDLDERESDVPWSAENTVGAKKIVTLKFQ